MSRLSTVGLSVKIAQHTVCNQLEIEILPQQRWVMLGRNGIGKTTLLHTLAGLRTAKNGEIKLNGKNIDQLNRTQIAQQQGILFQHQDDPFPSTVLETCLTGRHPHINRWAWESEEDVQLANQALQQVDLDSLINRQISSLSGGERQRLAIATLFCQQPQLLLLDEPTNHLDIHQQIIVLDLLKKWSETSNHSLIMTLHDLNLAQRYCTHGLLLLGEGEYIAGELEVIMTEANLERLYQHPIRKIEGPWGQAYLPH